MSEPVRPYKIFHLIKGLGRGGAETLLSAGLQYADRDRFTYGFGYFLPWKDALVSELSALGADVHCFSAQTSAGLIFSARRVAKYLRVWKADLIHCHLPLAGIAGRIAGSISQIPVVYTEHNLQERYHPATRHLNLWTWRWQKAVVAVSSEVATSIRAHSNSPVPVYVVENGIPIDRFKTSVEDRARIRQQFGIPMQAPVIGNVAAFRAGKNYDDWLRAAEMIRQNCLDSHFLLVGDGPLRAEMEKKAGSAGLSNCVHFAKLQQNVIPFYSAMDIFMSSSTYEGLPLALLEAMAMRLPVVATAAGGVPQVMINGKTGFLVDIQRPAALAERVELLLSDKGMRVNFGAEGRNVIEQRFSIGRMMQALERLYSEILATETVK